MQQGGTEQEASQGCTGAQATSKTLDACRLKLRLSCQFSTLGPSLLPATSRKLSSPPRVAPQLLRLTKHGLARAGLEHVQDDQAVIRARRELAPAG